MRRGGGGEGGGGICHLARSNARGHRLISVIRPRRFSLSLSLSLFFSFILLDLGHFRARFPPPRSRRN